MGGKRLVGGLAPGRQSNPSTARRDWCAPVSHWGKVEKKRRQGTRSRLARTGIACQGEKYRYIGREDACPHSGQTNTAWKKKAREGGGPWEWLELSTPSKGRANWARWEERGGGPGCSHRSQAALRMRGLLRLSRLDHPQSGMIFAVDCPSSHSRHDIMRQEPDANNVHECRSMVTDWFASGGRQRNGGAERPSGVAGRSKGKEGERGLGCCAKRANVRWMETEGDKGFVWEEKIWVTGGRE